MFIIFLFGTLAFFQHEISNWMRPELGRGALSEKALEQASALLRTRGTDAKSWSLSLPTRRGGEPLTLSWQPRGDAPEVRTTLAPATGQPIDVRDTLGGAFLFSFHYNLHYMPAWLARYLVCVASLAMLLSIATGIVTHKRIFKDFFTLRIGKGQRSWLDAHNVLATLALPFHLMITYTGLVALMFIIMPWAVLTGFADSESFRREFRPDSPSVEIRSDGAPPLPLAQLVDRASRIAEVPPLLVTTHRQDTRNGIIEAWPGLDRLGASYETLFLRTGDGTLVQAVPKPGPASSTMGVMIDLHAGRFSDYVLRWLYFLSGLLGTGMIATGLVLWVTKRRTGKPPADRTHAGIWLAERLNVGILTGSLAGIATYFLANRLLPLGMGGRAEREIICLFASWGFILVWPFLREPGRAWRESLATCAALYALVPVANAMTTTRGLVPSLIARDWAFALFDIAMLVTAAGLALIALILHRRADSQPSSPRVRTS